MTGPQSHVKCGPFQGMSGYRSPKLENFIKIKEQYRMITPYQSGIITMLLM